MVERHLTLSVLRFVNSTEGLNTTRLDTRIKFKKLCFLLLTELGNLRVHVATEIAQIYKL